MQDKKKGKQKIFCEFCWDSLNIMRSFHGLREWVSGQNYFIQPHPTQMRQLIDILDDVILEAKVAERRKK
jgi:hypothetical protein